MSFALLEPPHTRAQSAMEMRPETFQVCNTCINAKCYPPLTDDYKARATQLFKNIRGKFGSKITKMDGINDPYKHETRSMEVRMSQPMFGLQMDTGPTDGHSSRTASSMSTSPVPLCNSPLTTWDAFGQAPIRLAKSESVPAKARPNNIDTSTAGLVTNDQVTVRVQTAAGFPDIVVSGSPLPMEEIPIGGQAKTSSMAASATQAPTFSLTKNLPNAPRMARASSSIAPISLSIDTSLKSPPTPQPSSSAASVSPRKATPRITDMPPSAFIINEEGSARLSPSMIIRPNTTPRLQLPKMPAPSSRPPPSPPKPQSRLRSVPALSVDGTNEIDREADHDNAALGDSDEDEEGDETNGGSDEDGEDFSQPISTDSSYSNLRPTVATPTRRPNLPSINTTPLDLSFPAFKSPVAGRSGPAGSLAQLRREGEMTPTALNAFDYFSIKSLPGPSGTPREDNATPGPSTSNRTAGPHILPMPSTPSVSSRPSIYHQASKSMINLFSKQELMAVKDLDRRNSKGKGKAPAQHDVPGPAPEYSEGTLRRRRSMPVYNATSEPPPYPIFARRDNVAILPRDDEGKERLPGYSNSIHLMAIMPRKMEFSAPGVQAKDRKWRRTLCELQGTAFRVYNCPPRAAGVGVIGNWWENKVGVGDVAVNGSSVTGSLADEPAREGPSKLGPDKGVTNVSIPSGSRRTSDVVPQTHIAIPAQKPKGLAASLLHPVTRGGSSPARSRSHSRSQSDVPMSSGGAGLRQSLDISRPATRSSSQLTSSLTSNSNCSVVVVADSALSSPSRSSFFPKSRNSVSSFNRSSLDIPSPDPSDLIRAYTMQNAESGLGNDYFKRKNVIRVRLEGEQFLLQAQDVPEVVEWIEVGSFCMNSGVGFWLITGF